MKSLSIVIGGTIAIDNVSTPSQSASDLLGGSASYAAISANLLNNQVELVGIVGKDFPERYLSLFAEKGIGCKGIEHSEQETFTWSGEYKENMNDRETLSVATNVLENWSVKVPEELQNSEMVVLANMSPQNQLEMLGQMTAEHKFVIADTMDLWITIAREQLGEVLQKIDCLVLNESEAMLLAGTHNLIKAGQILRDLGPQYVIIKVGEFGSYLFAPKTETRSFYRVPAFPLENLNDPTGAGDSFLGAMAGYLAETGKTSFSAEEIRNGMVRGSVAASFTCEDFSTRTLQKVDLPQLEERMAELKEMSCW